MNSIAISLTLLSVASLALIRWAVSLHPYSGAGKPPMFGDFEAQRHWMEITVNLPIQEWYRNGSHNDLQYWGLDYPPLTAYHSWLCGYVSQKLNASWVDLMSSRGIEDHFHKLFMRYSVMIPDLLIYCSGIFFYYFTSCNSSAKTMEEKLFSIILMLLYPGLIIIDHGHFQYNCISLGFTVWAVGLACLNKFFLSSVLFTLALNYKQMELYHAAPFFFFFLGRILFDHGINTWTRLSRLVKVGVAVVGTFLLCWFPFLTTFESASTVFFRIFPLYRGLFEDKVSNFWCSLSTVIKLKNILEVSSLVKLCLFSTLLALTPSMASLFIRPTNRQFKYSLFNSALAFYLFSYQVHEKSILLPAVASILLYSEDPLVTVWFLNVSTFSMLPLIIKDDLVFPAVWCSLLFNLFHLCRRHLVGDSESRQESSVVKMPTILLKLMFIGSCVSILVSMLLLIFFKPPRRLPDLFVVFVSVLSCLHFILFFIYFNVRQIFDKKQMKVRSFSKVKSQ